MKTLPLLLLFVCTVSSVSSQVNKKNFAFRAGVSFYQPSKMSYEFRRNNGIMLDGGIYYQWLKKGINTIGINYTGRTALVADSIEHFYSFVELEYLKAQRIDIVSGKAYFDFGIGIMLRELINGRMYTPASQAKMEKTAFRYGTLSLSFEPKVYVQGSAEVYYFGSIRANKELFDFGDSDVRIMLNKYTLVNVSFGIGFIL